jgi:Trk K+ transport system NAD-binding subunit
MPKKYKISIVFIKRNNEVISPEPETVLLSGDELVLAGFANKISSLASLVHTHEEVSNSLKDVFGTE